MAPRAPHKKTMSEEQRLEKNARIAQTKRETKERRSTMDIIVRSVKIQKSKLSRTQKKALDRVFLEGKWLYNTAVAHDDFSEKFRVKLNNTAEVKLPDGEIETRTLEVLGGQLQQGILSRARDNIKGLKALKDNGHKVGKLKFITQMDSIPLKQFGSTHRIRGSKMKIANIPGWMRVGGLHQFHETDEYANAVLVRVNDDYFINLTVYRAKDECSSLETKKFTPDTSIGLDMGVKTQITFSDGSSANPRVKENDRLRGLQRKMARQQKGSNSREKTKKLIRKEYKKISRKKTDSANKIVSAILDNEHVFMQDENLKGWRLKKSLAHGSRAIQHGIMGRVKELLVHHPRVTVLDRHVATTATCVCGAVNPHSMDQRVYSCPECGYHAPRDKHAAENMIRLAAIPENIKT